MYHSQPKHIRGPLGAVQRLVQRGHRGGEILALVLRPGPHDSEIQPRQARDARRAALELLILESGA